MNSVPLSTTMSLITDMVYQYHFIAVMENQEFGLTNVC